MDNFKDIFTQIIEKLPIKQLSVLCGMATAITGICYVTDKGLKVLSQME